MYLHAAEDYDEVALIRSAINSLATSKLNSLHCQGRNVILLASVSFSARLHKLFTDPVG